MKVGQNATPVNSQGVSILETCLIDVTRSTSAWNMVMAVDLHYEQCRNCKNYHMWYVACQNNLSLEWI
jgi:hypothetical protein